MKLPLIPTILVGLAVATMIGLGIWQLQRKGEKEALIAQYEAAADLPPVAYPVIPDPELIFRRATGFCLEAESWRSIGGRNRDGRSGWQHIAACRTGGGEGPGMQVALGWSLDPEAPEGWNGGEVTGTIVIDRDHITRLVADEAPEGLEPLASPNPDDVPNNHLAYAIQWFLFALIAVVMYWLALRKRWVAED